MWVRKERSVSAKVGELVLKPTDHCQSHPGMHSEPTTVTDSVTAVKEPAIQGP